MARHFSSSSLDRGNAVLTATPFTMACWFKLGNSADALDHPLISICRGGGGTGGNFDGWWLDYDNTDPTKGLHLYSSHEGGNFGGAITSNKVTDSLWHFALATFTSTTSRTVFLDNGTGATDATSVTPASLAHTMVSNVLDNAGANNFGNNQDVAEACWWNVVLNASERAALFAGIPMRRVRPGAILAYLPVWGLASPEPEMTGPAARTWTLTGTAAQSNHPPVTLFTPKSPMLGTSVPTLSLSGRSVALARGMAAPINTSFLAGRSMVAARGRATLATATPSAAPYTASETLVGPRIRSVLRGPGSQSLLVGPAARSIIRVPGG